MSNGIGGDLFAIYWDAATGKAHRHQRERLGAARADHRHLRGKGNKEMPQLGIDTVTVPGCVDGWAKLHQRFGRLPWADLFRPAVYFATTRLSGHRADSRILARRRQEARRRMRTPRAVFLPHGQRARHRRGVSQSATGERARLVGQGRRERVLPRRDRRGDSPNLGKAAAA